MPATPDKPVVMPAPPPPANVPVEQKQAALVEEKPAAPVEQEPATAIDEKPHAEAKPDVAALYKEHQYADVVTACNASKTTLAPNATTCTVAACKQREVSKARRWFGSVAAAKRANVQRECGTILPADKPATADDECKRDPLACQH
jgi:hypothetical protein